ncbi:DNA polymerase V [Podospora australis]|uniref:DNA polymerase V n=1 Tax=Podospora australis TaxID=1536484 RepID=A0AAN6X2J9_9PEZI|nr:DNA polymerase V [Podospora australis]
MANKRKRTPKEAAIEKIQQPTQKRSKKESSSSTAPTKSSSSDVPAPPIRLFTSETNIDERRRETELYDKLGREDEEDRIAAAGEIFSSLLGGADGNSVPEPILRKHLEKRLFRGLASGRNASRLGFSLVLTLLLAELFGEKNLAGTKYKGLTFDEARKILVRSTTPFGNPSGQEERNHWFGQLFGIECFVRSGILFGESNNERWSEILDLLLELSRKKSWLKPQCGYVVVQAVEKMDQKLVESTLQKLADEGFAKTPEGVGIWITALDKFPNLKVPAQPWKNPLATTSLAALPAALKDSGREEPSQETNGVGKKQQIKQGSWTAQLHFVWDLIPKHFEKLGKKSEDEASEQFKQFWNRVVDEAFFSKNASDSQKFSGFMIFQKMLEGAAECQFIIKTLFSKNIMVCLMNQAAKEDRYLHRAALKALKAIDAAVQTNPTFLPTILKELFGKHGAYNFDQRTNTKTVDKLLQHTTPTTIKPVLKVLQLKDPSKSGLDEDQYYQALGNYLLKLSSVPPPEDSDSTTQSVPGSAIKVLAELAYSNKDVPEKLRETLRTRATSAFAKLIRRPEDFGHLCDAILSIEAEVDADDEVAGVALPRSFERLKDLLDADKATKTTKAPRQALALLYAVAILQIYNQDPDVLNLFEELEECYSKFTGLDSKDDSDDEGDEGVSEFLVEILLAILVQPSALMRQVSQQVFEAFTGLMTPEAIELLTEPLSAEESAKGKQALFNEENDDLLDAEGGSEDEEEFEGELDSDVEMVDLEDAPSEADDDSESSSDNDEEEDEEESAQNQDEGALDALEKALSEALGNHRLPEGADDDDAGSDHGSDMTDSEMLAVDEKLAEVFRQRAKTTSKKKEKKDAKETVVNFKHRVLDLLAVFVKKESVNANPLVFDTLIPLLNLIRTTTVRPLANKAHDAIQNFAKGLKRARSGPSDQTQKLGEEVDSDDLLDLLRNIHEEASKDPSHAFAKTVSTASLAVASVICRENKDMIERVAQVYMETQIKVAKGEVRIQPALFENWLNWCQSHGSAAFSAAQEEKEREEKEAKEKEEKAKMEKKKDKKEKKGKK